MLELTIKDDELWDEENMRFIVIRGRTLRLEHSLVSISKWEKKWKKSFLKCLEKNDLNIEQTIDYIKCMTLDKNVDDSVYNGLTNDHIQKVNEYISDPQTATHVPQRPEEMNKPRGGGDVLTSEMIYFYMISYQIPVEFEKWPLNRLMTLIKICDIKNNPPKKMSAAALAKRNTSINAARRAALNTKG